MAPQTDAPQTDAPQRQDTLAFPEPLDSQRSTPLGFLLDAVRRRPAGRSMLSALTFVLFVAGIGLFMYPFFTDLYTEQIEQRRLADDLEEIRLAVDGDVEAWEATVSGQTGRALTSIAIPAIGLETLVVEGTSPAALRAGAGHYPNTPLPGQAGNVAIAGHRTTYGRPFNRLDELAPGDEIWLSTPVGDHRYVIQPPPGWTMPHITDPRDWSVIAPPGSGGDHWLTLTTCHPKGSAATRLVVRAVLAESMPAGWYDQNVATAA